MEPAFVSLGKATGKIDVRLSYRIVELFSEGLYSSAHKAVEELVANSFDAGARNVSVVLSSNLHDATATILVVDDGQGMDAEGLRQHWLVGISNKRALKDLPLGRQQIGKFGIGKLATYVLADRLTHISKQGGKYVSTSMNFGSIDRRVKTGVEPKAPIQLQLRELSASEAQQALSTWTKGAALKASSPALFGKGAPDSWTVAILSSLKPKVHEIRPGMLKWVLRTALPLRPDFNVWLNGEHLTPSKAEKGLLRRWVLGRDLVELPKPAPKGIAAAPDNDLPGSNNSHYGLIVPQLGRITGTAEAYKDLLTGKSDSIGRSHGFFVYVYGRLVNVVDGHFGIPADELRHGTFGRFRLVIHIDALDDELRSNREAISEGPLLAVAQNVLRAVFNATRPAIEAHDAGEEPGVQLSRKLAQSPASLSRSPILELARAVIERKAESRYLRIPSLGNAADRSAFIAELEDRAKDPGAFFSGLLIDYNMTPDAGIAVYDTSSGVLHLNAWHPFVATFHEEFASKSSRQPLEIVALAEVVAESLLYSLGVKPEKALEFMQLRDQLLRNLANESGRKSPFAVALSLRESRNDPAALEQKMCDAFVSLGLEVRPIGGKGEPDGVAVALLPGDDKGIQGQYSVSLDSKSKLKDRGKVAAGTVKVSTIARHRDKYQCDHALVIGRDFPAAVASALLDEIKTDRKSTKALGSEKTITLMTIDDLAMLVQLRPVKRVGLRKLRELFQARSHQESHAWVEQVKGSRVSKPPYRQIVATIVTLQKKYRKLSVKYAALRVELSHLTLPIEYDTDQELVELCTAMAQLSDGTMFASAESVELDQSAENVIAAIESATREHLELPEK